MAEAPPPTQCPWCGAQLARATVPMVGGVADTGGPEPTCPACNRELRDTRIGLVLDGKYRIDSLIGQGGFGRVYRATHLSLACPVAVKFLLAQWASRPDLRARFKREAAALVRLHHPGIVVAHDFGEVDGSLYLVMEFVHGASLADEILTDGELLPHERVVAILDQVLQVLEAAHHAGIVHRDLKPENILLVDAGDRVDRVKVLDFGLAMMEDSASGLRLTAANTVNGTPHYMSPEQCLGDRVGPASDIYSLGVILFEMLAGEPPFSGSSGPELMAQHLYVDPPAVVLRGVHRPTSPDLERIARWALSKKAEERPTAAQLRDSLAAFLTGAGPAAALARAVAAKAAATNAPRDARGLTPVGVVAGPTARIAAAPADGPTSSQARVALLGLPGKRGDALRTSLGVHGIQAEPLDKLPVTGGEGYKVVVLAGDRKAGERLRELREDATTSKVPVIAIDIIMPESIPDLIRAGVSDAVLAGAGDDVISGKILRLIRRGR